MSEIAEFDLELNLAASEIAKFDLEPHLAGLWIARFDLELNLAELWSVESGLELNLAASEIAEFDLELDRVRSGSVISARLPVATLERVAAASALRLGRCGREFDVDATQRATLGEFLRRFRVVVSADVRGAR